MSETKFNEIDPDDSSAALFKPIPDMSTQGMIKRSKTSMLMKEEMKSSATEKDRDSDELKSWEPSDASWKSYSDT